jgi:hypothetical protein
LTTQFDRLKQDVIELDNYIAKLKKKGQKDLVSKISRKREYLANHIAEKQQLMQ